MFHIRAITYATQIVGSTATTSGCRITGEMARGSNSAARYVDNEEQRHARYGGTAPALNAANVRECIAVYRQLKRGCGMDAGQRHALGGAPSRSECAMRSVAPHRAAICDPTSPRAMYSAARYVTSLRWTSQEPTNMATVSQIAPPQGLRGFLGSPWDVPPLDFP